MPGVILHVLADVVANFFNLDFVGFEGVKDMTCYARRRAVAIRVRNYFVMRLFVYFVLMEPIEDSFIASVSWFASESER